MFQRVGKYWWNQLASFIQITDGVLFIFITWIRFIAVLADRSDDKDHISVEF